MFQTRPHATTRQSAFGTLALIYHSIVRDIRQSHRNAVIGLAMNMVQAMTLVLVFYLMFEILGLRGAAIRGDFLLYIMSGIFLYITHIKAVSAVVGSDGPASAMMLHAPMNSIVAICSAALAALYNQIFTLIVVLLVYHLAFTPITIDNPQLAMGTFLIAWFSGVAVGTIFRAAKPWAPGFISIITALYLRANMIASGKMFVANSLPATMLPIFDWNPLFHAIDQCRGAVFLHYNPHFSSTSYPMYVALTLLLLGMMGEFYTRKAASPSWSAGR